MKHSISITLSDEILFFLEKMSDQYNLSKSYCVDEILKAYKKQTLAREFSQDASNDTQEDLDFINADFSDFITILNHEERQTV